MSTDDIKQRAEARFQKQQKQTERARAAEDAMAQTRADSRATREKTARLKTLRLAKEAADQESKPVKKRSSAAAKTKAK